ncbi:non-classical arabinogalactan protein 31-like [Cucurbita moschata]|uniref:Non-classical arabinogalactan protein 31-like n=1 Tax=Cucurbita moschata TaxID=3662 RepID=A0A6J1GSI4_CUCMO|nr:non-classical arabinogalactan protein 31-like [Cucurbita moschata]
MASLTVSVFVITLLFHCSVNVLEAAEYHESPAPAPADHHLVAQSPQHLPPSSESPIPHQPPSQSPVPHPLPPSSESPIPHQPPSQSLAPHHLPPTSESPIPHQPPSQSPVPHPLPPSSESPIPHQPPSQSPVPHHLPPSPSPHYAPVEPPKPHTYHQRRSIEVEGVVYCKSCKYPGVETLLDAKPLSGAMVQMTCKNTKHSRVVVTATTDNNGYFWLATKDVSSHAYHRCKVYNVKSSNKNCTITSKMNGGIEGAELRPVKAFLDAEKKPVVLYSVGPLAYEPTCPR